MLLILVCVLGILATAVWVAFPLIKEGKRSSFFPTDNRSQDLLEAKEAVYRSILDLEFDRKMDKVSEEDYAIMRAQHESEALNILAETHGGAGTTDVLEIEIAAARKRLHR